MFFGLRTSFLFSFVLIGIFSASAQAQVLESDRGELILQCMQPVNLDDPNFVQGSELFFDIYLEGEGVTVWLTKGTLEKDVLFIAEDALRVHLDEEDRSLSAEWSLPSKVSLVVRQFETRWHGEFWFSEGLNTSILKVLPGRDVQISCVEKGRLLL